MSDIQYLDPEIANEGAHAQSGFYGLDPKLGADGEVTESDWSQPAAYQPFIDPPRIPDYNFVKTSVQGGKPHPLRKYFPQYTGVPYRFQPLPVWVYHAKQEPRLLTTVKQAEKHGLKLAANKLGLVASGEWSLDPIGVKTFDPERPGAGKSLQTKPRGEADQAALIGAVVAQVIAQSGAKPGGGANALASDPDFAEFQAFKAWRAGQNKPAKIELTPAEERAALTKLAGESGIKVKDAWSLDKIKDELDKAGK